MFWIVNELVMTMNHHSGFLSLKFATKFIFFP